MLAHDWEYWAETIINAQDLKFSLLNLNELSFRGMPLGFDIFENKPLPKKGLGAEELEQVLQREAGNIAQEPDVFPKVIVGWDTRESSPHLVELFKKGLEATQTPVIELGLVTTP